MSFTVTPTTVDAGVLARGNSVDLEVAFAGVDEDVSGTGTVTIGLGSTRVEVAVHAVAENPDPVVVGIEVPASLEEQGVTVTVPRIDFAGATIRVSRA